MNNLPPAVIKLFEAANTIAQKLGSLLGKFAGLISGIAIWLFDKFVDLFQYIAGKL